MRFTIPIQTVNPTNRREHWRARAARVKAERLATHLAMYGNPAKALGVYTLSYGEPVTVTLERVSPRLLDSDAVPPALKGIRDQIAAELGTHDGPRGLVTWLYAQSKGKPPCVVVTVEAQEVKGE